MGYPINLASYTSLLAGFSLHACEFSSYFDALTSDLYELQHWT